MSNKIEESKLTAYVLGELSAAESLEVEQYLRDNPGMADEIDGIRESTAQLQQLFSLEMDSQPGIDVGKIVDSTRMEKPQEVGKVFDFSAFWKIAVPAVAAVALFYIVPNFTDQSGGNLATNGGGHQSGAIVGTTLVGAGQEMQLNAPGKPKIFNRKDSLVSASIDWDSIQVADLNVKDEIIKNLKEQEGPVISCLKNFSTVNNFAIRVYPNGRVKAFSENGGFNHCISQMALSGVDLPVSDHAYDVGVSFVRD